MAREGKERSMNEDGVFWSVVRFGCTYDMLLLVSLEQTCHFLFSLLVLFPGESESEDGMAVTPSLISHVSTIIFQIVRTIQC